MVFDRFAARVKESCQERSSVEWRSYLEGLRRLEITSVGEALVCICQERLEDPSVRQLTSPLLAF